ncbi:MAG: hypothetical protein KY464_17410, partial [Gemmatimonadetes bacterium]|nr:hypothetical protein [Gemmatimonadota bacterium]
IDSLSATLPGETEVQISGDLRISDAPGFHGHARAVSTRPAALSAWWRGKAGSAAQLERFTFEADVEPNTIARARLDPSSPAYRTPPANWRDIVIRLAEERIRRMRRLVKELRG